MVESYTELTCRRGDRADAATLRLSDGQPEEVVFLIGR